MKKIIITLVVCALSVTVYAQKVMPKIKVGTTFSCIALIKDQEIPLDLKLKSMDGMVSIGWSVVVMGGSIDMSKKAVETATKMYMATIEPGIAKTSDDETFMIISKAAFKSLSANKSFTYNGANFKIKAPSDPFKLDGKVIDATHVVTEDGKLELWILNDPNFPFILQSLGLPTDISVLEIR